MLCARTVWRFALVGLVAACVCGCQKPAGFVGTWKTGSANQGGADSTMTFNKDETMSFVASNGPKQPPYKLTGIGTWKAAGDQLTVTPMTMELSGMSERDKATMTPYVQKWINVPQTGPVVWKGSDEFICTKNGIAQDFKRVR